MSSEAQTTDVYVMAKIENGGATGPVKVGLTKAVGSRLGTIQTSTPFKIGLVSSFRLPTPRLARDAERIFHRKMAHRRAYGEWFDINPAEALDELHQVFISLHGANYCRKPAGSREVPLSHFLYCLQCPHDWVVDAVRREIAELCGIEYYSERAA